MSWDGVPLEPYTLRVTHVYRRENGEWKIVHRHGDRLPIDQPLPSQSQGEGKHRPYPRTSTSQATL